MTVLYFYDDNKAYDHSQVYIDDTQVPNPLPANATTVAPEQGLYGIPKWTGTTWVGITRDEWLAQQPEAKPVAPTIDQQFQAQLALQMATMQKNQAEFNAQILLQLADTKEAAVTQTTPATPATSAVTSTVAPAATSAIPTATLATQTATSAAAETK
ncbi:hypothetical protein IMAU80323_02001 [Lactiplantibacillus plantarum]|nr:hypothetical protein [Lactiplantibacillus plantarum]MCG0598736.1 hypothetical protein [Lactiplantibacillus plantarum]MCG0600605.1 hypothetical protein [Lactiplantibacillus plantarum]MCG0603651.1 hypothetical protein [Lactiplantibacillus plantarum]MCG0741166.1 hypothetical protein [Lactiplantibacillus plantarum]